EFAAVELEHLPSFMMTTRLSWHKQGMPDARSREETAELAKRVPLLYEEKRLKMTAGEKKHLAEKVSTRIQEAIAAGRFAPLSTFPEPG
ncbi:MAG TPA: hypothetical protein VK127_02830, partial [Nitrososphaerales archaeon]|nr:hypothetical protein [Nitrososphaerales archaeon]